MGNLIRTALIVLVFVLVVALALRQCREAPLPDIVTKTDTVYKYVPLEVPTDWGSDGPKATPKTVNIYTKPNKPLRKRLERDTLVGSVRVKPHSVEVLRIDSAGYGVIEVYTPPWKLPNLPPFTLDTTGRVIWDEKAARRLVRKEKWRKVGRTAAVVGGIIGGIVIGNQLAK